MRQPTDVLVTRFTMEIALACLVALVGAIVTYGSLETGIGWSESGPDAGYFPFYIGIIIIIASSSALIESIIRQRHKKEVFLTWEQGVRVFSFFGPLFLFVVLSTFMGMYVGLIVYLFCVMVFQGHYSLIKAVTVSLGTAVLFYCVFEVWFQVPLLKGPLEPLLGIH